MKSVLARASGIAPTAHAILLTLVVAMTLLAGRPAYAASGTYLFRDTLAPLEGAGNTLVPTFNNGAFVNGSFVNTTIDSNVCPGTPTVRGWSFPQFGGLMTPNNAPAVVGGSYTISMIVKFNPMGSGYSRLIDFSNSTLDTGIYELNGAVSLYPVGEFAAGSFVDNRYSFVTFTRNAATNVVSVFVGTTPAGTYTDTGGLYVPSAQNVIFLMDNTTGSANISESSAGIITYIKLIDTPVTAGDISALQNEACNTVVTPTYAITVAANPPAGGTALCTPNPVLSGNNSVCTATPNTGYTFSNWSGDCSGATCTLTGVTSAKSVTANFTPVVTPTYAITVSTNPPAGGTALCTPNPVTSGGNSVCTATANGGYTFSNWSGDCSGATCTLNGVTSTKSVTANFTPVVTPTYAISVSTTPPAGGTALCTPNPVTSGGNSVCTATPNAGYIFTGWTGDCSGVTCTLTGVTATKSVTANFAPFTPQPAQQIPTLSQMGTLLLAGLLALLAGAWVRRRDTQG